VGDERKETKGIYVISTHRCFWRLNASSPYIVGRREYSKVAVICIYVVVNVMLSCTHARAWPHQLVCM
jgi:hypothetical protein